MTRAGPFLWGAQYYRAPTPAAACWAGDLDRIAALGMTDIKLWAQWRWASRDPERLDLDDLTRLLDLAHARSLRVTINTIFDVAPSWLLQRYPDCLLVDAEGRRVALRANACRQLGGFPGPCLRHPGAAAERRRFLTGVVDGLRQHPALAMWDVWNEPEQNFFARQPREGNYVCYCAACRAAFIAWLRQRHADLDALNARWGRCYRTWDEVEAPLIPDTLTDWLDWREFHCDGMTAEAAWRLALVRDRDPAHAAYLHVVPSTMDVFNSISGPDDFALARLGPIFAATCNAGAQWLHQLASAGAGRLCYNVESHINYGSAAMHQRVLGVAEVARELVPQIGQGIAGFLFWQYRSEVLGVEGPAWGLVTTAGEDRPVTAAVARIGAALAPYRELLVEAEPPHATIGLWKSRRNEIIHYGIHQHLGGLFASADGYLQALYRLNLPVRFIDHVGLEAGAAGLRLLILPAPYCLGAAEARALDAFVRGGGHVLSEAHLGAWDPDRGRHSPHVPGQGLAEAWGLQEVDACSTHHLAQALQGPWTGAISDDVRKAMAASGAVGGSHIAVARADGSALWGMERFARLEGEEWTVLGTLAGVPCLRTRALGAGRITYAATHLGQARAKDPAAFERLLREVAEAAGIAPVAWTTGDVHVDCRVHRGRPALLAITAGTEAGGEVRTGLGGTWRGILTGQILEQGQGLIPAGGADVFVREDALRGR